ncbi:hypothetical protein B5E80_15450 [Flavonifractor sp. An135]|nr:hypothetical protein [Flavonifractor sp. An135]OUQ22092.1 hypothetical protein B5E80_15450 [Flavonifractor sp. An135]
MELKLRDGDYVPDGQGGVERVEGARELLERVLWKLTVRRGSFPLLPELGSRLYLLPRAKPGERSALAAQYAAEALADEAGLVLNTVTFTESGGTSTLRLELEWRGESFTVETVL